MATGQHVEKVEIEDGRAVGVRLSDPAGGESTVVGAAVEVLLSAGSIKTPQILMLSGVGDQGHLTKHGIKVEQHLPGVGANLMVSTPKENDFLWRNHDFPLENNKFLLNSDGFCTKTHDF